MFPIGLAIFLGIACLVIEIYLLFSRGHEKNIKLKAGAFYGLAASFGAILGYVFLFTQGYERKMLSQIYLTSFIYTVQIFLVFSVFSLLTVRRTVKYFFNF